MCKLLDRLMIGAVLSAVGSAVADSIAAAPALMIVLVCSCALWHMAAAAKR